MNIKSISALLAKVWARAVERRPLGDSEASRLIGELRVEVDQLRRRVAKIGTPPMLVTTIPRSGRNVIGKTLARGLQVPDLIVANQYFPYDRIRFAELKKLAAEGGVSQDHFDAHPFNVAMVRHFTDRVVAQVRDPRPATLSWVRLISSFRISEETYKFIYPVLPRGFFEMPLENRMDWAIENWTPLLIEWMRGWAEAEKIDGFKVKFTHYEDMIEDEVKFFDDLLDFFAIPRERFTRPDVRRDFQQHFRKAQNDEWRSVLTPAQVAAANKHIPRDLAERFGWSLD